MTLLPVRISRILLALCVGLMAACNSGDSQAPSGELPQAFRAIAIGAGDVHTCALIEDGTVKCWGANRIGQLVENIGTDAPAPITIKGISNATALAVGGAHACALLANQTVKCWGSGINWIYGVNPADESVAPAPVAVAGLNGVTALSAGGAHTCALLVGGMVKCWGKYINDGTAIPLTGAAPVPPVVLELDAPTLMSDISVAVALASGASHTCAVLADRTVKCWGVNQFGQLGDGAYAASAIPVPVSGLANVEGLAAGARHTCAVLMDRTMRCWGSNSEGQLGDGSTAENVPSPVTVAGITHVAVLAAGEMHTCVGLQNDVIKCWGRNSYGQLGGDIALGMISRVPVTMNGIDHVAALSAGRWHTCVLTDSQNIHCWGHNQYGQLGNGAVGYALTVVPVIGLADARAIAAGGVHACALLGNGTVVCWGDNRVGQLGNGTTVNSVSPVLVSDINNATALVAGSTHTCALLVDRTVKCWGFNGYGSELPPAFLTTLTPVRVVGLTDVVGLAADWDGVCAVIADGTVKCWQVGTTPATVDGLADATMVTMGWAGHVCALRVDRTVKCWTFDRVSYWDGTGVNAISAPIAVSDLSDVIALAAGVEHTCAVLENHTVKCWGDNFYGQLGDGTRGNYSLIPVEVKDIDSAIALGLGWQSHQSCAVLADQTVKCWGWVNDGQIEDVTYPYPPYHLVGPLVPEIIVGLTGVSTMATGNLYACALLVDHTVKCWGYNGYGQLGNGVAGYSATPVRVAGS